MPYVKRDQVGRIVEISEEQSAGARDFLPNDHPEIVHFLQGANSHTIMKRLNTTDTDMARISEDLIDVLVSRNILNFTDLPLGAQKKLIARQKIRKNLTALSNLVTEDDDIL